MHHLDTVTFTLFLIFSGAAIISTAALFTRQSMLVAYIVLGALLGPFGFNILKKVEIVQQTGDIGIMFLLFLLGLNLHPQKLVQMFSKMTWVALASSVVFALIGFGLGVLFGYDVTTSWVIGLGMMFSSTIIGLKLLPTTVLHHQHTGEVMISVLLLQDIIAIMVLMILEMVSQGHVSFGRISLFIVALPLLLVFAFFMQRFVLIKLLAKFDRVHEYIFLLSVGWCLAMAILAEVLGLSANIGAFIAGVALAAHPISQYISENLKPLRDFFLIMFFFSIGAQFDSHYLPEILAPAILLAIVMLVVKPLVFRFLIHQVKETKPVAWEVGARLGQASEFTLLLAYLALSTGLISAQASCLIQAATLITFIVSSYVVVLRYPSPLAFSDKLRRN
ncbi:MAG: sodium:proton antiporter [Gammaproteobacteria bacterium CG11_big_fil_rev_8_21_14_0_20_46_22]|nr:MAG: sodium:proton antiporter [Gammaproteobacteria bacterium CG12_big_fil_rev_8_21_14_0_65_46_12]PIR10403.1 MAG: sodium:proton antiporter [Gammaproteobacteria bacterium CG11_big_fil_rev_8_21_14_0_20_46_22]